MIICDICKKNQAYEVFSIPKIINYWAMSNGVRLAQIRRLEKTDVVICSNCQAAIAKLVNTMESGSVSVGENKFGFNEQTSGEKVK